MNIPQWLTIGPIGLAIGWGIERLRMWNAFRKSRAELREAEAKAMKAELDLKEFKDDIRRNRERREFDEGVPLYIEAVEVAFEKIKRSSPERPNAIPLSTLVSCVDMDKATLRKILGIMQDRGAVKLKPSTLARNDEDVIFLG